MFCICDFFNLKMAKINYLYFVNYKENKMSNRLQYENSPYLLEHKDNPVDWYPWGEDAFKKAQNEHKPIFLSIGYSTCHWCHVMAKESFENKRIADFLNKHFVSIKVDREERPDIDAVYMKVCQSMTGNGGWPTTLFLTPDKKPFFAGTYFPPETMGEMIGFYELIETVSKMWDTSRDELLNSANEIILTLENKKSKHTDFDAESLIKEAVSCFSQTYDKENGGFGNAPKFPMPHSLIFLMLYGKLYKDDKAIEMATHTLRQMRKGGIYDHIGCGFSRYSTDNKFFVPHFEKMLYDNALLIMAYSVGYSLTKDRIMLDTALKTCEFVIRELEASEGGFYSALDADSEGIEGAYYLFKYDEILNELGKECGKEFCSYFGVTPEGNYNGKSILNRLNKDLEIDAYKDELSKLLKYRKNRTAIHLDDKKIISWNSLMIIALTLLYRVSGNEKYLLVAQKTENFIRETTNGSRLYVSICKGKTSGNGFLNEYANYAAALLFLYSATGDKNYLQRTKDIALETVMQFSDNQNGFNMCGRYNEELILTEKECYDGALPSGNGVMAFVLTRLSQLTGEKTWGEYAGNQKDFLKEEARVYPAGFCVYLLSLLLEKYPQPHITAVCGKNENIFDVIKHIPLYADITLLKKSEGSYKLLKDKTTYYVCTDHHCQPPTNKL